MPARDEPADHAGIIALSDEDLQPVLVLKWYFHIQGVRIVDFPQQIAVMKCLKGRIKFPSILLHRRLLLDTYLLEIIINCLFLSITFLYLCPLAELHDLKDVVHLLVQGLLRFLLLASVMLRLARFLLLGIVGFDVDEVVKVLALWFS